MNDNQELFTKYMEEFKKLDSKTKKSELLEKVKALYTYINVYATSNDINYVPIKSGEINDLTDNPTDDDYVEAIMVYIQNIEELLGLLFQE